MCEPFYRIRKLFRVCANDKSVHSRLHGRVSVFAGFSIYKFELQINYLLSVFQLLRKSIRHASKRFRAEKSKFAFSALCACTAPKLLYTKCSPAHAQTIPRAKLKIQFFDPLRMRKLENGGCTHLLVRCAIDSTIVIFHFLFSISAHARPQNCCARPLGCTPRPCLRVFSQKCGNSR